MNNRPKTRLIRTEVIWTKEDDDPDERCPCPVTVNFDLGRKRKTILLAILALIVVAVQDRLSSQSRVHNESRSPPGWGDGLATKNSGIGYGLGANYSSSGGVYMNDDAIEIHKEITLPKIIDENLADVDDPLRIGDIPYFFHTPRTMGQTVKGILGNCVGLKTTNLTATIGGIYRAKKMGLVESGKVDVVVTQYLHSGATLFDDKHRGRMFTFIRHPIERAVSLFHYLAKATHEPTYDPALAHISIEMWSRSKRVEHNWMTRFLSNELEGDLSLEHLEISKEVLRKKCIVGLFDEKSASWVRLERFFGWKFYTERNRECLERLLNWGWSNKNLHPTIDEGSIEWDLLYKHNELDMELYQYAQLLFEEQRDLFGEGGSLVNPRQHDTPG